MISLASRLRAIPAWIWVVLCLSALAAGAVFLYSMMLARLAPTGQAMTVSESELLVLLGDEGTTAVAFDFVDGCSGKYAWRHFGSDGLESAGSGQVFEKYEIVDDGSSAERTIRDGGGELTVNAGPYSVDWSCNTSRTGFIYLTPDGPRARTLGSTSLESFVP